MNVIDAGLEGLKVIKPDVHGDARGWFCEQYNAARFSAFADKIIHVVVDDFSAAQSGRTPRVNSSRSWKSSLKGLQE